MTDVLSIIFGFFAVCFLLIVLFGAPYVPTHKAQIHKAFEMIKLPEGSTLIDLGSGDGVILKEAAKRGYYAIGYELNPILAFLSILRCWSYRERVKVHCRDFWLTQLPPDADALFIFLAGPYMKRFANYMERQSHGRRKSLLVLSYGFKIPNKVQAQSEGGIFLYEY